MEVTFQKFRWVHTVPPTDVHDGQQCGTVFEDILCAAAISPIDGLESELTSHVVLTVWQGYDIECARDVLLARSVLRSFGSGKIEKINVC